VYLFLLALHLLYYYLTFFEPGSMTSIVGILGYSLVLLHTPVFFIYVKSLAKNTLITLNEILLHLIPYTLFNTFLLIEHFSADTSIKPEAGFLKVEGTASWFLSINGELMAQITLAYLIYGIFLYRHFKKRLYEQVSNVHQYHDRWLLCLLISFSIYFSSIYAVIKMSVSTHWVSTEHTFIYVSLIVMLYIFILGFIGLKHHYIFLDYNLDIKWSKKGKYEKSGLTRHKIQVIKGKLENVMSNKQAYLNENLTLPVLAKQLEIQPTYLSQVINQEYKKSFFDYVNEFRVEEVKTRLLDEHYDHLSVLGIALDCGFKSKSSFNKFFKQHTGMTPSQYRHQQRK
ncbi:MAG: helix-turn-helix domain-containing protein, partial [Fulvivirga sp.]|nr:helix-turn-helix domain-containing protein [Fulvivirga sp.]